MIKYEDNPLISIIIPTYNREKTIVNTVESLVNQTYRNLEIIIVDDCSVDETEKVVKKLQDERIIYHKLDRNRRACYARNYGFKLSKGEYIALMDSDDICHYDRIEKQLIFLKNNEADFVFCGMNRTERNGNKYYYPLKMMDFKKDIFLQELEENYICSVCMFMKRRVFEETMFDVQLKRYQDWDFGIRVCKKYKIAYLNEALIDSVIQNDSITNNVSDYESLLAIYNKYNKEILGNKKVYSEFMRKFGETMRDSNPKLARDFFWKSVKSFFRIKVFIKLLISSLNIRY